MGISRSQLMAGVVAGGVAMLAVGVGRLWSHHSQLNRFDGIVTALQERGENRVLEGKEVSVCYNTARTGGIATDGESIYLRTPEGVVTAVKTRDPLLQTLSPITAEVLTPPSSGVLTRQIFGLHGGLEVLGSFEESVRGYCSNTLWTAATKDRPHN